MPSIHQYEVVGRRRPTEGKEVDGEVFRMKLFAPNPVVARSRFWYYLSHLKKIKRANGEIISTREIFEKNPNTIKNFAIWIRYDSRSLSHNMYREVRATTLNEAIEKTYATMASLHRARKSVVQIVKTAQIPAKACKRPATIEYHNNNISFRLPHRVSKPSSKAFRKTFKGSRPSTFF